ncbi:MAG: GntR family transcriptional regulator [Longimicrobiales bacterium]
MPEIKRLVTNRGKRGDGARGTRLLRETAYERLKDAIRDGELQPGEPLSEARISEAFQISRTPVREALQQLAQEGLVQFQANRTVTVAALSLPEVLNVLHLRSILEPEIARLVAESISKPALDVLKKSVKDLDSAANRGDRAAWSKADTVLHETLAHACPNDLLGRLGLQMRNRMQLLATDSQTTQARLIACTAEHQAIVDSIARGDGDSAQAATREHLRILRESFFKRLGHT